MTTRRERFERSGSSRRLKRGELLIHETQLTKEALERAPRAHRGVFLMMGQIANEVAILQAVTKQALNGLKGHRASKETALGTAFLMARMLSGRLYEAWKLISQKGGPLLQEMEVAVRAKHNDHPQKGLLDPSDLVILERAHYAGEQLRTYFEPPDALLKRIRNKLAFHFDQKTMEAGYDLLPDEIWPLIDFHTGHRGSTFYGGCDTVAAFAVSHLVGGEGTSGADAMLDQSIAAASAVVDFTEGFMLAFLILYLDEDYRVEQQVVLKDVPDMDRARVHFFLGASARLRRTLTESEP